jgi:hypothetical protein
LQAIQDWDKSTSRLSTPLIQESSGVHLLISSRSTHFALVAQGIEQQIPNLLAAGSIPAGGTKHFQYVISLSFCPFSRKVAIFFTPLATSLQTTSENCIIAGNGRDWMENTLAYHAGERPNGS